MNCKSTTQMINNLGFQLSDAQNIDADKYTVYDVMSDPKLDNISIEERLSIFQSWQDDLNLKKMMIYHRYGFDGTKTQRTVFDPSVNKLIKMVNFASNDYLNMSQHPQVIEAGVEALLNYGAGAGASCNGSGQTKIKHDLEKEIAETFEYESSLVYPTGFMTNTGVLSAILKSRDVAVVDMFAHASIMDAVESRNKMLFRHNNMRSLEATLVRARKIYNNIVVVVDGVYSMDGDIANLPEIVGLCKKYNCLLMVDEAHAFGVIGKNGLGILDHFDLPADSIDILTGTLSKSIGSTGGFVTGKKELINYLRFASRPYFFTTAPFIAATACALESIKIIKNDSERRINLWKNIRYFRSKLENGNYNIGNAETAIFPIILGDHHLVMDVTKIMGHHGVLVNGIPYPAVPRKQTRLRLTVTAEMTKEQMDIGLYELNYCINKSKQTLKRQNSQAVCATF